MKRVRRSSRMSRRNSWACFPATPPETTRPARRLTLLRRPRCRLRLSSSTPFCLSSRTLAIPPANKLRLGDLLDQPLSILPGLWSSTSVQPQIQFAAVSLGRLLLTGCPPNVARVCAPLPPDTDSPAHARSNLHVLIDVFRRADAEPTKLEAGRAVAAICRVSPFAASPAHPI